MEGTRFQAISSIQQTGPIDRIYGKKHSLGHSTYCMNDVNVVLKLARTILKDGINGYFQILFYGYMASVRELTAHTHYSHCVGYTKTTYSDFEVRNRCTEYTT
jgi:hypothetical protein